ncbi:hypothetical protein [Streptomyces sp. NPDC059743]|uniref:hypothetical protein n=1 Tax=Streptomyces sp. NPDC059743 TaxID=3346928 RepID=UPI0036606042
MSEYTVPGVGAWVVDTERDAIGEVLARRSAYVQLRAPGGGTEWDADPACLRAANRSEELLARVIERNRRTRL